MESSPLYPSDERGPSRDRTSRERPSRPSPSAEGAFVDPRREEAPRAITRAPLEGVIRIRHEDTPAREAAQMHMQQQAELATAEANKDKDKKDKEKRDDGYVAPPTPTEQPQPTAPTERPADFDQIAEASDNRDQEEDTADTVTTEEDQPQPETLTAYYAEQTFDPPAPASEQTQAPESDGLQRTWYYTPPAAGQPQPTAVPSSEATASTPDYWQTAELPIVPQQPAETSPDASPAATESESGAWHYDADRTEPLPIVEQGGEQPDPVATYEETTETAPDDPDQTSANPLFSSRARVSTPPNSQQQQGMTPSSNGPGMPNMPPNGPGGPGGPMPPSPFSYFGPNFNQAPPTPAIEPTPSSRLERLLYTERPHTHRGLLLGVAGGLVVGHLLSRRRTNQLSERIDTLQADAKKSEEKATQATQETQQAQRQLRTEQQRTQQEIAKLSTAAQQSEAAPAAYAPTVETRADVSGSPVYAAAVGAGMAVAANMAPRPAQQPEQRAAVAVAPQAAEQQPGTDPNQSPEAVDQQDGGMHLRPGERIKQSAWHTYVEKDGHVVEDAINYGQGFRQEQQQEFGHPQQFDNNQAGTVPAQVYDPAQQGTQGMYGTNPILPSGLTTPSLPVGQPTHADAQHQLPEHTKSGNQIVSNFANPWFWLMLALIFAAFFITITV